HIRNAPGTIGHEDRLERRAIGDQEHFEAAFAAQPHHFNGAAVRQLAEILPHDPGHDLRPIQFPHRQSSAAYRPLNYENAGCFFEFAEPPSLAAYLCHAAYLSSAFEGNRVDLYAYHLEHAICRGNASAFHRNVGAHENQARGAAHHAWL